MGKMQSKKLQFLSFHNGLTQILSNDPNTSWQSSRDYYRKFKFQITLKENKIDQLLKSQVSKGLSPTNYTQIGFNIK